MRRTICQPTWIRILAWRFLWDALARHQNALLLQLIDKRELPEKAVPMLGVKYLAYL